MQAQRYVYPVDLTETEEELEEICAKLGLTKAEAIRDSIENYYNYVKGLKVIELRQISKKQAEAEILAYIKKKGTAWTSEISDGLRLDVLLVNEILHKLAMEGRLK